ncbi:MAG: hypothetical protein ED557_02590 [Balneola sp.]|nr:MAG: hypothetical protein ED557_02590 [Balneola sp.]
MKKVVLLSSALALLVITSVNSLKIYSEQEAIKDLLMTGYVHGAFNELNPEAMEKTFHKDFAIFSAGEDGEIRRYPIANWVANTKRTKEDPNFNPEDNKWGHKFTNIDITGNSASVKLELIKDGELVYTDYLSLLKFDEDWKVVAKVYYQH